MPFQHFAFILIAVLLAGAATIALAAAVSGSLPGGMVTFLVPMTLLAALALRRR